MFSRGRANTAPFVASLTFDSSNALLPSHLCSLILQNNDAAMDSLRSPLELSPLDRLLVDLRTRNERDRGIARKALANSLAKRSRDLTTAAFGVELDVLASRLLSLASSLVTEDAFAAVAGVGALRTACDLFFHSQNTHRMHRGIRQGQLRPLGQAY